MEGFQLFSLRGFQRKSPGELLTTWKTRLDLARAPMPGSVGWHCLLKLCVLAKGLEGAGLGSQGSRGLGVQGSREQQSPELGPSQLHLLLFAW